MIKKASIALTVTAALAMVLLQSHAQQPASAAAQAPAAQAATSSKVPVVTARLIPDSIAIGDHFRLRIEVTQDVVQQVGFPEMDSAHNKLTDFIEVLGVKPADTVKIDNRRITIGREYILTTFQAGKQLITHIPVLYVDKNITDTIYAHPDTLLLQVGTFEIDTTKQKIYDIKAPMRMPLKFGEFSGWLLIGLAVLAIIALIVWLIIRWRRNKSVFWRSKTVDPPHIVAIRALEALHHQKLWQNNRHKAYYTLLTDIIRTYIEDRWNIPAMEKTTGEIMQCTDMMQLPDRDRTKLESILRTADLAKFAKFAPSADDNEAAYNDAYYFVEDTKPAEAVETAQGETQTDVK